MTTESSTKLGTRTTIGTLTNIATLASATYGVSPVLDLHNIISGSATAPNDVIIEFEATPGTVSGNKQAIVFAKTSMDGSTWSTGPESSTTVTDQPNLERLGYLPLNSNTTQQRRAYSLMRDLGFIPYAIKFVVFNDSGAAFSAAAMYYTVVTVSSG